MAMHRRDCLLLALATAGAAATARIPGAKAALPSADPGQVHFRGTFAEVISDQVNFAGTKTGRNDRWLGRFASGPWSIRREGNSRFRSGHCALIELRPGDEANQPGLRERCEVAYLQGVSPIEDWTDRRTGIGQRLFYAASFRPGPCVLKDGSSVAWQRPRGTADPDGWIWGTCWDLHRPDSTGEKTEPATFHLNCEDHFYLQWSGGQPGTYEASERKKVELRDGAVYPGEWSDFVLDAQWATVRKGHFKLWRRVVRDDGSLRYDWRPVLELTGIPTLQASRTDKHKSVAPPGKIHYWKTGYYRSYEDFTTFWRIGGMVRGASFDAVKNAMWVE